MAQMVKKVAKATYDFSVDGGAAAAVPLAITEYIPAGAIVTNVITNERTPLTSGGSATVTIEVGSADMTGALAFDTGFTGGGDTHALASSAEAIEIATGGDIRITIGTTTLTAGVLDIYIEYIEA